MSDRFSDPDPAEQEDEQSNDEEGPDPAFVPTQGALPDLIDDSVSCEHCIHRPVCEVRRGFENIMAKWQEPSMMDELDTEDANEEDVKKALEENGPPVDPDDLALICEEFEPGLDEDIE